MRGPLNTTVTLTIARNGQEKALEISITRDVISVSSGALATLDGSSRLIRLTPIHRADETDGLVKAINDITTVSGDSLKGFILDLRNNPGGLLDRPFRCRMHSQSGRYRLHPRPRAEDMQRFEAKPDPGDLTKDKPLIILINGGSASARKSSPAPAGSQTRNGDRPALGRARDRCRTIIRSSHRRGRCASRRRAITPRRAARSRPWYQKPGIEQAEVVPDNPLKGESELGGEASRAGISRRPDRRKGSQSYIPTDASYDKALNLALVMMPTRSTRLFPPVSAQASAH